jgi:MFS family permease
LLSGLFYLAPGFGYVVGTLMGGRWADYIAKKWMRKRGKRVPEDRLRSSLIFMGVIIPSCMLIYGWSVQTEKGGIALPVIAMFVQGVAQLFCFPSLNVYCIEIIPERTPDVIAGNYAMRFLFGAFGTAIVLPAIEKIGVGWFSTISAGFLIIVTLMVYATIIFGERWRTGFWAEGENGPEKQIEDGIMEAVPKQEVPDEKAASKGRE